MADSINLSQVRMQRRSTRPLSSDDDSRKPTYIDFIKSCYHFHPEAFNYYNRLEDHLVYASKSGLPVLQDLKIVEALSIPADQDYPIYYPFDDTSLDIAQTRPRVVILEGLPLPDWIEVLGYRWSLRPEFFIPHVAPPLLDTQRSELYELPSIPSRQENVVHIQFISLVDSLVGGNVGTATPRQRRETDETCQQCQKDLFNDRRYGCTRYRRINLHNLKYCSIEQMVSLTVGVDGTHWTAIALTDQGKGMVDNHRLPWTRYNNPDGRPTGTVPLVPYNNPATNCSSRHCDRDTVSPDAARNPGVLDQFHPLKNVYINDAIDADLLACDPFFLLVSILTTAALSQAQLLNFLEKIITECQMAGPEQLHDTLEDVRYTGQVLRRIESSLAEKLYCIDQGGCAAWPKAVGEQVKGRKALLQHRVRGDYQHLIERCGRMMQDCESTTTLLVNYSQLLASERSIAQANEIHRLTMLASFFIPVGLVASAFGMNVKEIQRDFPSVWKFIAISVAVSVVTLVGLHWARIWSKAKHWKEAVLTWIKH